MNREFLRGLGVTEDIIPQIINQHHDALRPLKEKAEQADSLQTQVDSLNGEITSRDTELESLREKAKGNEELNAELDKIKQERDARIEENRKLQLNSAIKVAVAKEANDPDDILAFLKTDSLNISEDGRVEGLEDAINTLKESKPYLFTQFKTTGRTPPEGGNPVLTREEIMKIEDPAQRQKAIKENIQLFN